VCDSWSIVDALFCTVLQTSDFLNYFVSVRRP